MDLDYRLIFHVKKIVSDEESGELTVYEDRTFFRHDVISSRRQLIPQESDKNSARKGKKVETSASVDPNPRINRSFSIYPSYY